MSNLTDQQCEHGMPRPGGKTPFCPTCGHGLELGGTHEIGNRLGVSRSRAHKIIAAYEDFPEPTADLIGGRVWLMADVERWIEKHPQRPTGRPKK